MLRAQGGGDQVGALVEPAVAQAGLEGGQRDRVRRAQHLQRERLVDAQLGQGLARALGAVQQRCRLGRVEHRQALERQVGLLAAVPQHSLELGQHGAHRRLAVERGAVFGNQGQGGAIVLQTQRQVVARGCIRHRAFDHFQPGQGHGGRCRLHRQHHVVERIGGRIGGGALAGHPFSRRVEFGLAQLLDRLAGAVEQGGKRDLRRQAQRKRQRIDHETDYPGQLGARTAGQWGADDDRLAAAVAVQQDRQRGGHGHERGRVEPCEALAQGRAAGAGQHQFDAGGGERIGAAVGVGRHDGPLLGVGQACTPLLGARFGVGGGGQPAGQVAHVQLRRRCDRELARLSRVVMVAQFAHQDAHRPAVAGDVVHIDDQVMAGGRLAQQAHMHQLAGGQVEVALAFLGQHGQHPCGPVAAIRFFVQREGRRGQHALARHAINGDKGGPQRRVPLDQAGKGGAQGHAVERAMQLEPLDVIVEAARLVDLVKQPQAGLGVGQRIAGLRRGGRDGGVGRAAAGGDAGCERAHGAAFEKVADRDVDAEALANAADQADRAQRIAADLQVRAGGANLVEPERFGPQAGDLFFELALRGGVAVIEVEQRLGTGQGAAVDLAVQVARKFRQLQQVAGQHAVGQALLHGRAQRLRVERAVGAVVADQHGLAIGAAEGMRDRFRHFRARTHGAFDFGQFDAYAIDLDLAVGAADEFDPAVGAVASQVAGAIDLLAALGRERVGDKGLRAQLRVVPVAIAGKRRMDMQFANFANVAQATFTQDQQRRVVDRLPERHDGVGRDFVADAKEGLGQRGFGRAVQVHELHAGAGLGAPGADVGAVQGLAGQRHEAQRGQRGARGRHAAVGQRAREQAQQRGHAMHQRD